MWSITKTVAVLSIIFEISTVYANKNLPKNILELTINAKQQNVEIVWQDLDLTSNSIIRLTDDDSNPLLEIELYNASGWFTTNIHFDYVHFRKFIDLNTNCYGYWAHHVDAIDGTIYSSTCMKLNPHWMNELRPFVESLRFRDLFIPGTHDSGAYKLGFDPNVHWDSPIHKYSLTQDEDIYGQLMHGIRYLDIRPAYYKNLKTQFWVNHGVVRLHPMDQVLRDVYKFVKETNEIVCVDFHQFPNGFDTHDIHRKLVQFVKDLIGDQVVELESVWDSTLGEIWSQPKRIIFAYNYGQIANEYEPFTWEGVRQRWAEADDKDVLKEFFYKWNNQTQESSRPVADMVQLTPTALGVITDQYKGLRKMADDVNQDVSEWYFRDLGWKANIVAADFFRGTTIVQNAIWMNKMKIHDFYRGSK